MLVSSALIPKDEAVRLRTLRSYNVLLALREPVFTEFVALAARIFSLPISLIALVEETQVYYPANYGMPGNTIQPRQEALCSTAILQNKAVVYRDLQLESAPIVTAEAALAAQRNQLRFYAGAPLCMPDHSKVGTLCVIDRQPRTFSAAEQHTLELLAALVSRVLVVRHACWTHSAEGAQHWEVVRGQLMAEVQELTALVRYMCTRYGAQTPVSEAILDQVKRRLGDLHEILEQHFE